MIWPQIQRYLWVYYGGKALSRFVTLTYTAMQAALMLSLQLSTPQIALLDWQNSRK
jgi:hypothetical protein